jgi:hypothetical protein
MELWKCYGKWSAKSVKVIAVLPCEKLMMSFMNQNMNQRRIEWLLESSFESMYYSSNIQIQEILFSFMDSFIVNKAAK